MQEEWVDIKGYEGLYEVSNTGIVRAKERLVENNGGMQHKHARVLSPAIINGYYSVHLYKNSKCKAKFIHRLVAENFIPKIDGKDFIDHIDTDRTNNSVDNLRWVTRQENSLNPITRERNSISKIGHKCYLKHHTEESKEKMRNARLGKKASDETRKKLSDLHKGKKLSAEHIEKIRESKTGKHWKIVDGKREWY